MPEPHMTKHKTNVSAFIAAASSTSDNVVKAYCGMVAIELVLKHSTGLKDHNVPGALNKFAEKYARDDFRGCKVKINTLSNRMTNALKNIGVQGVDGVARFAPSECYPYIRYARHSVDGWPEPSTTAEQAKILADIVAETRSYLLNKFKLAL
jgi:hypothetical protein